MNILILSWRGPKHPNAGGAEISTHEHAKGWVKAGHKVTLFTSSYDNAKYLEYIDGVRIIRKSSQVFGVHLAAFKWFIFDRKEQFDIVIDQFHGIPFFTPLYVRGKKMAFIHEVTKEVWKLNSWPWPFNKIVSFIGEICEPLIFKLFYKRIPFMTVSKSTQEDLLKWGILKDKITIIHNGIRTQKKLELPKEKKKTGIFIGAISKDKGIEDALEIFSWILKSQNDWQFWVVGKADKKYFNQLKNIVQKLSIDKTVKFFGFIPDQDKYYLLSRAHILINPSIREGWGLTVIEAASVGTPTVGYNVAGLKDSIVDEKTGLLCDVNPVKCSQAVLNLIADKEKYNRFRHNCIKWSKEFNWDKSSRKSFKLIKNLVNK